MPLRKAKDHVSLKTFLSNKYWHHCGRQSPFIRISSTCDLWRILLLLRSETQSSTVIILLRLFKQGGFAYSWITETSRIRISYSWSRVTSACALYCRWGIKLGKCQEGKKWPQSGQSMWWTVRTYRHSGRRRRHGALEVFHCIVT